MKFELSTSVAKLTFSREQSHEIVSGKFASKRVDCLTIAFKAPTDYLIQAAYCLHEVVEKIIDIFKNLFNKNFKEMKANSLKLADAFIALMLTPVGSMIKIVQNLAGAIIHPKIAFKDPAKTISRV